MRAIMVMFDSLNRRMLPNYGCNWVNAPNFKRLGERAVTFDSCYAGSLPCMPARRELHTGRYNFLHRSWGPLEPFDDSMPEILKSNGVYTHLVSDHGHYWEDGGCTYHTKYSSWEISRGQEGDPWKGHVKNPLMPESPFNIPKMLSDTKGKRQDVINRKYMDTEEKMSQAVTFSYGLEFIENNYEDDKWFLQIETFDPHEPFFASQRFKDMYPDADYEGADFDWPPYGPVNEDESVVEHGKKRYAALLSMCDYYLGKVLDMMDCYDMWKDTMLIVNTDHGYLLGEHGWWSKMVMPVYNEIANTPLFIWNPKLGVSGERRNSLVQTVDIAPTLLDFFNIKIPKSMDGKALNQIIESDIPVREAALFGMHGGQINITDGEYVYMRGPINKSNTPLYDYTLMPTHMNKMFQTDELQDIQLMEPFEFTKGCRTMKIESRVEFVSPVQYGSKLFNIKSDPGQLYELEELDTEVRLINIMTELMKKNDAPADQYERLGLLKDGGFTREMLISQKSAILNSEKLEGLDGISFEPGVFNQVLALLSTTPEDMRQPVIEGFKAMLSSAGLTIMTKEFINNYISSLPIEGEQKQMTVYFMNLLGRTS